MLDRERLARVLGSAQLAALRQRLRKRYRALQPPEDVFTLGQLAPAEAEALAGLLGRGHGPRASMRLSHAALDAALHDAGIARDLRAALEALDGPITDTEAARAARQRAWADAVAQASHPRLTAVLGQPQSQGLLKRLAAGQAANARQLIAQAERVLTRLPAPGVALARLAADTLGDAHALDRGRPVATLVLHALASDDSGQRARETRARELWASQGVLVNELAKPVAVLNLAAAGESLTARLVQAAGCAGEPLHLSLRQLSRAPPPWRSGQRVFVCENPEVLAAAADALGPRCPPMVSLDGQLSAAPRTLLDQLAAAGADFRYHGDFDWGGLAIANFFFQRYGGTPWHYAACDYRPAAGPPLKGDPVPACWDAQLADQIQAAGTALHEEAVLSTLLRDLEREAQNSPEQGR